MKEEKITSERTVYSEECPICKKQGIKKEIKAFSKSNLEYNMKLHKEKHEKENNKK